MQEEQHQFDRAATDEVLLGVLGRCRVELDPLRIQDYSAAAGEGVSAKLCAPCHAENLAEVFFNLSSRHKSTELASHNVFLFSRPCVRLMLLKK